MKSEKFSGVRVVSQIAIEMRRAIIELAGDRAVFDSRSLWLERAARIAGISTRTAKSFFYCETNNPNSSAVEKVRAARARKNDELAYTARHTYADMLSRISALEEAMRVSDENFHKPEIDALRDMDRRKDKPLD